MGETLDRVPAHLRHFVVQQDYEAYTAVDQAVWRFVLLQMFERLRKEAHPAYARGLAQTGMSVERIPRIFEMDACLRTFGWGAVCVDGFIPPRAFQEFQALSILPIAADMRRVDHLAYTPAPDIIHEAGGHAPILPDPEYAAFLRRISAYGMQSFASRRDAELYEAVRELSIVKEQRNSDPGVVTAASRTLAEVVARHEPPSEAARLSRLYWWTVEYGLVGTPADYRLYGAGLLSSLAESFFCHDPSVAKLVLSREAMERDYDITRPQPQLYVARDFAHLTDVLEQCCADFAFQTGGQRGLSIARDAGELATVEAQSGLQIMGTLRDFTGDGERIASLEFHGHSALGANGRMIETPECGVARFVQGLSVAFDLEGALTFAGGRVERAGLALELGADIDLTLALGLRVRGRIAQLLRDPHGSVVALVLDRAMAARNTDAFAACPGGHLALLPASPVRRVRAGVPDASFHAPKAYSEIKVPRAEFERPAQRELRGLYETEVRLRGEPCASSGLLQIHDRLGAAHPNEWLLRWNLLERLEQLGVEPARREQLVRELRQLEHHFEGKMPITSGLRHLGYSPA